MSVVRPNIPINQSTKIFFGLFIGYLVYITIKGELPAYAAIVIGTAPTANQTDAVSSGGAGFNPAATDAKLTGTVLYGQDGSINAPGIGSVGPAPPTAGKLPCSAQLTKLGLCG